MSTATVEVKYVNKPDKNPEFGSIKTADGVYYGVPKFMLADFQPGETYEIEYKTRDFKGREYHTIAGRPTPSSQTNGAVNKVMEQTGDPHGNPRPPYPGLATGVGDRDKNRHIFVCGAINNAVHAGGLEIFGSRDIIRAAIDNLVRAYDTSLLANPQKSDDMDDEIPL